MTAFLLLLGTITVASPLLTLRELWLRSWVMMWIAAFISLLVGSALIFSLGAVIFLLTNLQVAAAYGLRRGLTRTQALAPLLVALLIWMLVVPTQVLGLVELGGFGYLPLVALVLLVGLLLPISWNPQGLARTQ